MKTTLAACTAKTISRTRLGQHGAPRASPAERRTSPGGVALRRGHGGRHAIGTGALRLPCGRWPTPHPPAHPPPERGLARPALGPTRLGPRHAANRARARHGLCSGGPLARRRDHPRRRSLRSFPRRTGEVCAPAASQSQQDASRAPFLLPARHVGCGGGSASATAASSAHARRHARPQRPYCSPPRNSGSHRCAGAL